MEAQQLGGACTNIIFRCKLRVLNEVRLRVKDDLVLLPGFCSTPKKTLASPAKTESVCTSGFWCECLGELTHSLNEWTKFAYLQR